MALVARALTEEEEDDLLGVTEFKGRVYYTNG